MKEVSLYIPCFNAQETIELCLEAVFKQTYPIKEIVVVDDGSNDKTAEIVSRYPVRLIRHINNQGLAATRNTAIRNTNTEFIASLDADCIPHPDWLKHLMRRFDSPNIAGVGGRLLEYLFTIFDLWRSVHMSQQHKKKEPLFLFGSNTVFKKRILIEVGLYDENLKNNYEDVDISEKIKKKGFSLVYEPEAIVQHLKKDDIHSLLNNYWNWNFSYYKNEGYYTNQEKFIFKLKENIGLANRYIEEDISYHRYSLLYLDFLLALHHSLKDFWYFTYQDNNNNLLKYPLLVHWLSLLDLVFFYHLDLNKNKFSTLISKENNYLQNFFALNLILGKIIQDKFKDRVFKRILYKHLLLSLYKLSDTILLDKLINLIELHQDWTELLKKKQSNLDILFLDNLSLSFQRWLDSLVVRFKNIISMIEISAERTDKFS